MLVRKIKVAGRNVRYSEAGNGEPVLYLHGFPTSGYLWRRVMTPVATQYRAIAPDLPGFGGSDLLAGKHGWRELVDWLGEFVDAMRLDTLHLGVHDWGGFIGLPWLAENPDRVSSLLLTNTSFKDTDRWHNLAKQWRDPVEGKRWMEELNDETFRVLMRGFSPRIADESLTEFFMGLRTPEQREAKLEMYRSLEFEMLAPFMEKLKQAVSGRSRVIWGSRDPMLPPTVAQEFGERLRAHVTLLDAGHFLQEEQGEDVGRLHLAFLKACS